jgi:hypothetical protein
VSGKHNDHNFYFFGGKNLKNKKCLELLDLARKLIERSFLKKFGAPPKKIGLKKKCLELPYLARKLMRKTFENFSPTPTPDMCARKFPLMSMGG